MSVIYYFGIIKMEIDDKKKNLFYSLLQDRRGFDVPSGMHTYISSPNPNFKNKIAVEASVFFEHRFAFVYWLNCKKNKMRREKISKDEDFIAPDLVSWDWHDDSGADADVVPSALSLLDIKNENETSLYAWLGLPGNNDGQILPSIWLNSVGNVYIVQKQKSKRERRDRTFIDRHGNEHKNFYFNKLDQFNNVFNKTNSGSGVIWDIDLDFFTKVNSRSSKCNRLMLPERDVLSMLSSDKKWMPLILENLHCLSIALEPEYTGGISNSFQLYQTLESALFVAPLFNDKCSWRTELTGLFSK